MKPSRERWFIYRDKPFRPLYESGLGFQQPPTRLQLSAMTLKEKKRWHVWEFMDRNLARVLVDSFNANTPSVERHHAGYARMIDYARISHGQQPTLPLSEKARRRKGKEKSRLDDLA